MRIPVNSEIQAVELPLPIGRVLVVDDDSSNRAILRDMLLSAGHEVIEAVDGEHALAICDATPPDIVLLDVMMPGLDGYEVCRRLKASAATAGIPVLLVTAMGQRHERLEGIRSGANDFLTKPVDLEDLMLRVRNAMQLKRLHDRVVDDNAQLQRALALRDNVMHLVVHDMKSPMAATSGYLSLLAEDTVLRSTPALADLVSHARGAVNLLAEQVDALLDISRIEMGAVDFSGENCELGALARSVLGDFMAESERARINYVAPSASLWVRGDAVMIRRMMYMLLWNGLKHAPSASVLQVDIQHAAGGGCFSVTDFGHRVPAEYMDAVFDKYRQGLLRSTGHGRMPNLGLAFCKLAAEAQHGLVGAESDPVTGNRFWFSLPLIASKGAPAP